jgi:triacylglycerol lipase
VNALALTALLAINPGSSPNAATSSPVLLEPGFMGFRAMPFIGNYFIGLKRALGDAGADVYELAPPPVASSDVRGAYLVRAIDDVIARTGAKHVMIIAHSQGGLDARAALAQLGPAARDKVSVVVTLSSPHHGTDLADAIMEWAPRPLVEAALDVVQTAWQSEQHMPHFAADVEGALHTLSRADSAQFNASHASTNGVPFFSIGAVTGKDVDGSCARDGRWGEPDKIDALHPAFLAAHALIRAKGGDESDDGVVPTSSMRFGTWLGCVPGDHVDWMGWQMNRDDGNYTTFDSLAFLVELWHGMRDVEDAGDERAMDAHVPALAKLAHARVSESAVFATR